jgi:hypothetical protein
LPDSTRDEPGNGAAEEDFVADPDQQLTRFEVLRSECEWVVGWQWVVVSGIVGWVAW